MKSYTRIVWDPLSTYELILVAGKFQASVYSNLCKLSYRNIPRPRKLDCVLAVCVLSPRPTHPIQKKPTNKKNQKSKTRFVCFPGV